MSLPPDWQTRLVGFLHGSEPPDASLFAGGKWHDALGQIGVYQEQYWLRLIGAVKTEVRGWAKLHGDDAAVQATIRAYLSDCPSESWTLDDIALRFVGWLESRDAPLAEIEMARLDRAVNLGFSAAAGVDPEPAELASMPALRLQPHVQLLRQQYNVHSIRSAVLSETEAPELVQGDYGVVVFRRNRKMRHYDLGGTAFRILECVRDGKTVPQALEVVFSEGVSADELQRGLGGWFKLYAERSWVEIAS